VTTISWRALEFTSVLAAWSAADAPKDTPPKMDAIANESFEFIFIP
jgi:hypothetical protein